VRILLDEMYSANLVKELASHGIEAVTAVELGLAGFSDHDLLGAAVDRRYVLLTENVSDFARPVAERFDAGAHHSGVLIALSSRFSRRPSGIPGIAAAISAIADDDLDDQLVYLKAP
jgi:Domain of unknown function (DUF5615)